jgi:SMODS and SLOG-associating 2TM effector domain 1/Protein of unknown function (DUF4231)
VHVETSLNPKAALSDGKMDPLVSAARLQSSWSRTANGLKSTLDRARWTTFFLSGVAALFAAIASQIPESEEQVRLGLAVGSAVLLGTVSFLTVRLLGMAQTARWTRIRAASEALKREIFQYAAMAAPYDDLATCDNRLLEEKDRIATDIDDVIDVIEQPSDQTGSMPLKRYQNSKEYIDARISGQITWFENRAESSRRHASKLHQWEFSLSLVAAILTAAVGVAGKRLFGFPFDFAALTAVLTTVAATILAHIEASRYDYLTITYRATARRLEAELARANAAFTLPSAPWSDFVQCCEAILATENAAWTAKWSKV